MVVVRMEGAPFGTILNQIWIEGNGAWGKGGDLEEVAVLVMAWQPLAQTLLHLLFHPVQALPIAQLVLQATPPSNQSSSFEQGQFYYQMVPYKGATIIQ